MVRTPQSLDEAKQIYREEKGKVLSSLNTLIGSRWLLAVLAAFAIAFGVNLLYSPSQLPHVTGVSLSGLGLPDSLDWGLAGEQAKAARDAAVREGAPGFATQFVHDHRDWVPIMNWLGFGLTLTLLFSNLTIMTLRRRYTRG